MVFVFGSNEAGIHGAGAAKYANQFHGAIMRVGYGHHGNSFALPTKDVHIRSLPLEAVMIYVEMFLTYARLRCDLDFKVTRVGCGLAGFKDYDIAPMFKGAPSNCHFDSAWSPYLGAQHNYWGTV
jgi:hypothetical protein